MSNRRASGFTLVEMVIAIVIIGVGLAGVLTAFNTTVRSSADPLIHKQMLAVAEEMMEEVLLKPFTGDGVVPVNAQQACGGGASRVAFDEVPDYNNYSTTGICDVDGAAVVGLGGYNVTVAIDNAATLGAGALAVGATRVTVTVTHGAETITLIGWRTNYAA